VKATTLGTTLAAQTLWFPTDHFDAHFGLPSKVLGPNGCLRCWTYDEFGRTHEQKLDHGAVAEIDAGACGIVHGCIRYEDVGDPDA